MHAILTVHNFNNLNVLFESRVLCRAQNIAQKSVIWRGEDLKKSKEFTALFADREHCVKKGLSQLAPSEIEELKKYPMKGADTTGICFGASLWTIKLLLSKQIKSEKELIQLLDKYKNGFPAEAAALQNLHMAFVGYKFQLSEKEQEAASYEVDEAQQEFLHEIEQKRIDLENRKESLSREEYTRLFLQIIKETEESIPHKIAELIANVEQLYLYKSKTSRLERVAALIDLKLKHKIEKRERSFFTGIIHKKEMQDKFNQLKNGCYQLRFRTSDKGGHSIVYIKKDFGSYLYDPNFGLIKCTTDNPSKRLCELFKKHYKGKTIENKKREQFLEVFRYI